jgi:hypothetical protein
MNEKEKAIEVLRELLSYEIDEENVMVCYNNYMYGVLDIFKRASKTIKRANRIKRIKKIKKIWL